MVSEIKCLPPPFMEMSGSASEFKVLVEVEVVWYHRNSSLLWQSNQWACAHLGPWSVLIVTKNHDSIMFDNCCKTNCGASKNTCLTVDVEISVESSKLMQISVVHV